MSTAQFTALAADRKRRLRALRIERITRPVVAALGRLAVGYAWLVLIAVTVVVCIPLALIGLAGKMARGRA